MQLLLSCLTLLALGAAHAATPPPGEYRIDGEAVTRSGSGPAASERTERWDGATGKRTVTTHAGPPGNPGSQQAYAGTGPATWCVPATSTPSAQLAGRCDARWWPQDGGATLQADCQAGRLQEQWKQIDKDTWQRDMSFTTASGASTVPAATADAMAPVQAQIEQAIRTGTPEEAAAARQQLAALKAALGGGGAMATTTRLTERWTRIAPTCKAG